MYEIYGDYGYVGENLLEEFESFAEAVRWVKGYTRGGDMGGYDRIEIVTFAEDGELLVHYQVEAEDLEEEDDLFLDDMEYSGA